VLCIEMRQAAAGRVDRGLCSGAVLCWTAFVSVNSMSELALAKATSSGEQTQVSAVLHLRLSL